MEVCTKEKSDLEESANTLQLQSNVTEDENLKLKKEEKILKETVAKLEAGQAALSRNAQVGILFNLYTIRDFKADQNKSSRHVTSIFCIRIRFQSRKWKIGEIFSQKSTLKMYLFLKKIQIFGRIKFSKQTA